MQIFAYEMVTAGGLPVAADAHGVPASLLREGHAMIEALAADLASCDGVQVELLWDSRLSRPSIEEIHLHESNSPADEQPLFDRLAREADATIVIAPESDGLLAARCRRVVEVGGRLLGPALELVELATDKDRTARLLASAGVPTPPGISLAPGQSLPIDFAYPAVLKPIDGAGSQDTWYLLDAAAASRQRPPAVATRLEQYCPGRATSVAMLCGSRDCVVLPPCWQRLTSDGRFGYLGGRTLDEDHLSARAAALARRTFRALPAPHGYLGVDLVLGQDTSGRDDRVIEVNPRLTTSYIGLRHAVRGNLAQAWLDLDAGRSPALSFVEGPVEFDADGTVRIGSRETV